MVWRLLSETLGRGLAIPVLLRVVVERGHRRQLLLEALGVEDGPAAATEVKSSFSILGQRGVKGLGLRRLHSIGLPVVTQVGLVLAGRVTVPDLTRGQLIDDHLHVPALVLGNVRRVIARLWKKLVEVR